jgi:hypothetical protein
MARLKIRLLKPHFTPVDKEQFEALFRLALIEHFGSEDSATFAKWAHDYTLEQFKHYPTGLAEADQVIEHWREALPRAQCRSFEEWMRCAPAEPEFQVALE